MLFFEREKSWKGINSLIDKSKTDGENSIAAFRSEDEDSIIDRLYRLKFDILSEGISISSFPPSNQPERIL